MRGEFEGMYAKDVSIVIPCWWDNERLINLTKSCIKSLSQTKPNQVIVVNDGSRIDGLHLMKKWEPWNNTVNTYVERNENGGYAAAVNSGLKVTYNKYIIISNNDIVFIQPDWIEHLIKPLKEGYDISSIRTTDSDGWTTEDYYEDNAKFGSLWAITKEAYEKLGPLDESFGKGYYEDLDYWHRAQDKNIKIVKNHAGLVEHQGSATFKEFGDELVNMHYDAMIKYAEKYKKDIYLVPKDGGVILFDKYDCIDMNWHERNKMSDLSISVKELKKLLKARRLKKENDKRAEEIWKAVKNV